MEAILNVGLIVVEIIGIVFLLISTFLLTIFTIFLFKLNKFIKKQHKFFDLIDKLTSFKLFNRKENID